MDIWETNKLLLFTGFVIPGFISLKTYELLLPSAPKESAKQLIDAIAYSCINYGLLLWPIALMERGQLRTTHPGSYIAFYVFALLIAPVGWAFLFKYFRMTRLARETLPHPTARPWDYVFGKGTPYWVIVTLKDGKQIAGRYDTASFASSAPAPEHLYLEEAWVLNGDGGFERPRTDTAGIMVLAPDIVTIEFFQITH
jgi:hypothetical protein